MPSFAGPPLLNLTSLPSLCSYLPHPQSTNRESSTTEGVHSWTRKGVSLIVLSKELPLKKCCGFEVTDLHQKTQLRGGSQCHCGQKPQPNVFFPLFFVQRISLYHIGIAQLLAYNRTAYSGDVTPPPYIRLQMSSMWIYNATQFLDMLMLEKLNTSVILKRRLLRCLDSCFCLTFSDVVLVSSPHPPHPRMCLYYACVCIYMCVYIHTVYVYIYICSMCNLW